MELTPSEKAKQILEAEVYYWGQKGLTTTQRCAIHAAAIRAELIRINASQELLDFWAEVKLEIYKQGQ